MDFISIAIRLSTPHHSAPCTNVQSDIDGFYCFTANDKKQYKFHKTVNTSALARTRALGKFLIQ